MIVSTWSFWLTAVISHPGKEKIKVGGIKAELRIQGNTEEIREMTENSIPRARQFRLSTTAAGEPQNWTRDEDRMLCQCAIEAERREGDPGETFQR
jgi:hypothetical protein